jgi:anthranilate/para-aminobenzoate synthase component II
MAAQSKTGSSLIEIAISRAIDNLNSSTRALLRSCRIVASNNRLLWHVVVIAPTPVVWKRLVKRLVSITRRLAQTLGSFMIGVCIASDIIPFGHGGQGIIQRKFLSGKTWWIQQRNLEHFNWIDVVPRNRKYHHQYYHLIKSMGYSFSADGAITLNAW